MSLDADLDALAVAARALRDQIGEPPQVDDLRALRAWRAACELAAGRYTLAVAAIERTARRAKTP